MSMLRVQNCLHISTFTVTYDNADIATLRQVREKKFSSIDFRNQERNNIAFIELIACRQAAFPLYGMSIKKLTSLLYLANATNSVSITAITDQQKVPTD